MQKLVYQNAVLDIFIHKNAGAVILQWKNPPTSAEFRQGLSKGLATLQEHKLHKWIGDCTFLGAIDQADQEWSNSVWFPQALGAGITKMGVIVSDDIFNQLSVEEIMNKVEGTGFTSQYFPVLSQAVAWME
jgi:hypothetical protein